MIGLTFLIQAAEYSEMARRMDDGMIYIEGVQTRLVDQMREYLRSLVRSASPGFNRFG